MPREKSRHRDRRSSSYSSDSSFERKKFKSKHKRRSRSRDRSESSSKRRRSYSRSRRRRSSSRSLSRDRYESKSSRRSRSKRSRDRSLSRSSSRSKSKYRQKQRSRRSRSSSRSSSPERPSKPRKFNLDDTDVKVEKAIKAAAAAGLTMTKIPSYEYKEVDIKTDMPTMQDRNLIAELNSEAFVPKSFKSSRSKKQQNIVIDLENDTVKLPENEVKAATEEDNIFDFAAFQSEEELREMWVQKLYLFRKKMLKEETNNVIN